MPEEIINYRSDLQEIVICDHHGTVLSTVIIENGIPRFDTLSAQAMCADLERLVWQSLSNPALIAYAKGEPMEKEPITQGKIDRVFGLNRNDDDKKERLRSLQRHAMEIRDRMCAKGRSVKEINDWLRSMNFPV